MRRYDLEKKPLSYILNQLQDGNLFSQILIKNINFSKGNFFTILPEDANIQNLHKYKFGGILNYSTVPIKKNNVMKEKNFSYQEKLKLNFELTDYIFSFLKEDENNCALFEEFFVSSDKDKNILPGIKKLCIDNQLLYFLDKSSEKQNVLDTIKQSDTGWRFVAALFYDNVEWKNLEFQSILQESVVKVLLNIKQIIVGAYDGE